MLNRDAKQSCSRRAAGAGRLVREGTRAGLPLMMPETLGYSGAPTIPQLADEGHRVLKGPSLPCEPLRGGVPTPSPVLNDLAGVAVELPPVG